MLRDIRDPVRNSGKASRLAKEKIDGLKEPGLLRLAGSPCWRLKSYIGSGKFRRHGLLPDRSVEQPVIVRDQRQPHAHPAAYDRASKAASLKSAAFHPPRQQRLSMQVKTTTATAPRYQPRGRTGGSAGAAGAGQWPVPLHRRGQFARGSYRRPFVRSRGVGGENEVEREGLSVRHPAKFVLVGSGNPEEGELRPQLLDRFGLSVEVRTPQDLKQRVEIRRCRTCSAEDDGAQAAATSLGISATKSSSAR